MMSFSRNICFWSRHTTSWSFCPRTPKTSVPRLGPSACQQVARCLTSCQREERRRCGSQRSNECVIRRIWSRVSSYLPHRIRQEVWLTWGGDQIIQLQSTPSRKKVMHSILFTWDRLLGMILKISDTVPGGVAWRIFQEKQVILYRITEFELNDCSTSVTGGFAP